MHRMVACGHHDAVVPCRCVSTWLQRSLGYHTCHHHTCHVIPDEVPALCNMVTPGSGQAWGVIPVMQFLTGAVMHHQDCM
jgi:hypothetical protein